MGQTQAHIVSAVFRGQHKSVACVRKSLCDHIDDHQRLRQGKLRRGHAAVVVRSVTGPQSLCNGAMPGNLLTPLSRRVFAPISSGRRSQGMNHGFGSS